ncbi:zinc finger protein 239-like [Xenia sp. Carnegie-2017]|uniref:zinc finger protein 239-like n=1 Tax=Xenia sp. Carnegie-2017 TaxID=2897299 RepID=UPI001F03D1B2|nr:zinc finger protein 239-like [Xenia sp. Carnegie-2017]
MPHSFLVKKKDFKKPLAVQFGDRVFPEAMHYFPFPVQDIPQLLSFPVPFPAAYALFREYPMHLMPAGPVGTPYPVIRELRPAMNESMHDNGKCKEKTSEDDKKPEENATFKCPHCSKVFTRSWNFHRHVLIHSGQKPYKCENCPKAFALAAHLKIHNRIHTGEKPYTCNICQRGFAQLTNLQRHILTHTGQKPHKCTYCPKAFVSSSDLRRHVRIHTGERPYKCKQCTKAFTTSGNLQSHILTHTGEKPYQCKICKWKFISSSNLRTHMRIHHTNQETGKE